MHSAAALLVAFIVSGVPEGAAGKTPRRHQEQLLRISTPVSRRTVAAHPFVNVVVHFDVTDPGGADPGTFRAHLGGANITSRFEAITENDVVVGERARLEPALLHFGHRYNRLRVSVRGRGPAGPRREDVARVRFQAVEARDRAPVARVVADGDVIVSGIPLQFDGTASADPDDDTLTYQWDFGDGGTSSDPRPAHAFTSNAADATVRLTVSDGELGDTAQVTMLAVPALDPGRTPGILRMDSASALEFGGVPVGGSATRTVTIHNADTTPTSQLKVRLGVCDEVWPAADCERGGAFTLDTSDFDLGPDASAVVNVAFSPRALGHQSAEITAVASASNQSAVHVLGHAYGGVAPGTGPLPTSETLLFSGTTSALGGILPSGARIAPDATVGACVVPNNGIGTGDACLVDRDCAANGGTCASTGPASTPFFPIDMTSDGEGGLYLLSDDGTFTDPNPNPVTELDGTLLHLRMDAGGTRSGAAIVTRTPTCTMQLTSDALPAASGGQVYVAWYQSVTSDCFRTAVEQLVAIRKSDGAQTVLIPRIDAAEGLDPCNDDYDPADDLEAARDGNAIFVALPGGIYRIRPTVLLMTPDADPAVFRVHPDGSVLIVTAEDHGVTGLLHVYKISPDQAAAGAPHLTDLTPCATIAVPNDTSGTTTSRVTSYVSLGVAPPAAGSADGTILLSFLSSGGSSAAGPNLRVQGTFAISSPGGTDVCSVSGLVDLEPLDQLTF